MSTPYDGNTPPPGTPLPPPGSNPAPYPGVPAKKTSLPVWSLILSILSFVCFPVIFAIAGIITGFIGRGKAKAEGSGTGMATAGIIIGFANIVISIVAVIVLAVSGFAIFGIVSQQVTVAEQLVPASVAAEAYKGATGSYQGLSTEALAAYGYRPSSDVAVKAKSNPSGTAYCIEGNPVDEAGNKIHTLASGGNISITINGRSYNYSLGSCPANF